MTSWQRSIGNVASNWASFAASAIISLVLSPFIVHRLGDSAYGAWVLLGSLVGYLGLLDLGTRGAVTRYVASYHAAHRHEDAGRIASTALGLFGGLGLLAVGASAVLALLINHAFHVPQELAHAARIALVVSGVNVAVSLVSGVYGGIVVGMQRFDWLNAVNVALAVLQAIAILLLLDAGGGLVELSLAQLGVTLLRGGMSAWLTHRVYPELTFRTTLWSRPHLGIIFSFGITSALIQTAGSIINYADALVIGWFLPVATITFFAIASTMTDYVRAILSGISHTLTPMVAALPEQDSRHDVVNVILRGARIASLVVLPIVLTLELRGASFIRIWMGPAYAEPAAAVLRVLAFAVWAFAGFQIVTATMIGLNKHQGLIPVFIGEALLNVALSIVLVRHLGIVGVAWGTAVPRLVVSLFVGPLYARRHAGVPLRMYWAQALVRPAIGMIPFALATLAAETWWPAVSLWSFFGQVLVALVFAALGAWFVVLSRPERKALAVSLGLPALRSAARHRSLA